MCYNKSMKRIDVLKGVEQILVQKAYETGHISHRADGDWQKQADGSWKPYTGQSNQSAPQAQKPTENTEYGEITEEDLAETPNEDFSPEEYNDFKSEIESLASGEFFNDVANIRVDPNNSDMPDNDDLMEVTDKLIEQFDLSKNLTDEQYEDLTEVVQDIWSQNNPTSDDEDNVETPEKSYGDDEVDYTYAKDIDYSQYDDDIKSIEFRENDDGEFEPHDDDYFRVADKIYEQTDREDMSDEEADQLYDEIVDRVVDRAYELHNNVQKSAVRDMRSAPTTKNMGF